MIINQTTPITEVVKEIEQRLLDTLKDIQEDRIIVAAVKIKMLAVELDQSGYATPFSRWMK